MVEKNFILATAGHVDHGKSALVKALTGTDPDRLPEEKARGMTIDLGFAELNLDGPNGETFHVGIVDVPGHENFVCNMIAGIGAIDLALLVVAADDAWMPQTEEHLQILTYLGVKRAVIALTKADLAETDSVGAQVSGDLRETPFADSQIVSTSVRTGQGIENLKCALGSEFATLRPQRDIGKPRLFVDRAFTLRGIGTIVTGTLIGGQFRHGQNIFVQPRNVSVRIRSLQSHGRNVDLAKPGMRTAINLPDIAVDSDVKRGDAVTAVAYESSVSLDVLLTRSPRGQRSGAIKTGTSAYIHHGTTRVLAKIIFPENASLEAGESASAHLRLAAPLLAFVGDRFIVRDASERKTIAGGIVVGINSTDFQRRRERAFLASRAAASNDVDLAVWTEIAGAEVIEPARLLERSSFSAEEIAAALQRFAHRGEIFLRGRVVARMCVWCDLRQRAAGLIDNAHRMNPEQRGLELNDLRSELSSLSHAVFDTLIVDLCADGFVRTGSTISRSSHRASLPPEIAAAAEKVRAALTEKPFDPPGRKELAQDRQDEQALRFLIEQGEIIEISNGILLPRASVDAMRGKVSDVISKNGPATASRLREELGTSRRVMIPFLEYLDRIGVTRRAGDLRQLREPKSTRIAAS